ncbi:hypothetical protein Dshi_2550 [Dinoroseobacter shibae DFL 12 = DSM 16493]|jgi:hypothetical protein|uniref:Uncharacterized protein n=1 Tax=Dinoroseobacter shibae (strain DSM 16493 / NCIMB 14021 / DFL 12) TaxID=398580 RepID=A8LST4_DINSH|nr:DUF6519 domain-containing protein [Dinoroseobacter shibae]ABV94283.1 hypothetical protein Dshi_2550 [Dinoroseobacter shibae DFL 12 = DSM 16493]URF45719.1 DUF6519 domain-containing protein [Dinoroseobacter shibae]URF50024.1 DUF6519 domain-containing protein [Dinoroseobacter shibae]
MKTQLSQFPTSLHQPYSGVFQQQGRMITDADWNAAMQVSRDRLERALGDVIGTGTPEQGGIIAGDEASGFSIVWGDVYVDGLRGVLASRSGAAAFDLADQADFPGAPEAPEGAHRLYLDIWERSLTALEEPHLMDAALHGADTSTRKRVMTQVKLCPQDFDPEDPAQNPSIGEGRLDMRLRAGTASPDACEPCLDEIDVSGRVGNYAFRVEVHAVDRNAAGAPRRITLKWSRENGAEAAVIGQEPPGFQASDWIYEFYHAASEDSLSESHAGFHHPEVIAAGFTPAVGALVEGYPQGAPSAGFSLVRRWDGYVVLEKNGAIWEMATQTVDGESVPFGADRGQRLSTVLAEAQHGHVSEGATILMSLDTMTLRLELADHQHLAGDYWIGTVREALHGVGDVIRQDATPDGLQHHYMCLADVAEDGTFCLLNKDACKRFQFPPLTNLHADDVCYDNTACEMPGVENVQDALDHLCRQKDLKWHNKHLHGWGIVCGLIVECCPENPDSDEDPSQCVTVTKGYAIDCEGSDIIVEDRIHVDLMDAVRAWDAENPNAPILQEGRGTACLHIAQVDGAPMVRVEPHEGGDTSVFDQLMDGTLLGAFIQHCILDLINELSEELSFMEDGQLAVDEDGDVIVSQARRKFISFVNLVQQIWFKDNGPYVWLSRREYDILRELYDRLRALIGSKTFCGLLNADVFPEYPFPETEIDTWFGADNHTRLKADPTGARVYTYGGTDEAIHVFDTAKGELVEIIRAPIPSGGEVTAIALSPDGQLLYVAASVNGEDTVLGIAQVGETHVFEKPMQILCGITLSDMELDPRDPKLIFATGPGAGLYALRPDVLSQQDKPRPDPVHAFNATGQMAVDTVARRIFCPAAAPVDGQTATAPPVDYDRVAVCEMNETGGGAPPMVVLGQLSDRFVSGRDDIAVRPGDDSRVYLVVDGVEPAGDKQIITFDVPRAGPDQAKLQAQIAVQNSLISLGFDRGSDTLYASFAESFRLQAIAANGTGVIQPRIPVQLWPTGIAVGPEGDVQVVNALSSTVTFIPRAEVARSADRLAPLAETRWRILMAFYALVGNLFQYLKDCFCHHLLVKCPECDGSEKIYLACVDIRDGAVFNICNFGKRKYVQTFMAWTYWLSLVPIIPLMKQAIAKACCTVLPNFLDQFSDGIAPPPKPPEFGAASGVSTPVKASTGLVAMRAYKRADVPSFQRRQMEKLNIYTGFVGDAVLSTDTQKFLAPQGVRKESLQNSATDDALRNLQEAGIENIEVRPYDPKLADRYLLDFARTPSRLDPSAKIIVYERDGKAAFVAEERITTVTTPAPKLTPAEEARIVELTSRIEKAKDTSAAEEALANLKLETAKIETEVDALRVMREAEAQSLEALKIERDSLKTELEGLRSGLDAVGEMQRKMKVDVDSLRPVTELEGVSREVAARLERAGVRTIGDLATASTAKLRTAEIGQDTAARKALIDTAKLRLR